MRLPQRLIDKSKNDPTRLPDVAPMTTTHEFGGIIALNLNHGTSPTGSIPVDDNNDFLPYEPDDPAILKKLFRVET